MTEAAVDRARRLAEQLPGLGLTALMIDSTAYREGIREQQREAHHFEEARALGVSDDDARMILDRERDPAIERARTTPYPLDRDAMWQRVHDQLLRHLMGEPYDPHPRFTEFLRQLGILEPEERIIATIALPRPSVLDARYRQRQRNRRRNRR